MGFDEWFEAPFIELAKHFKGGAGKEKKRLKWAEIKRKRDELLNRYKDIPAEEVIFDENLSSSQKIDILRGVHGYTDEETSMMLEDAEKAKKNARTKLLKRQISNKAEELYGTLPKDSNREPIPDDVRLYVWNRDGGKCVKCGSQQKLEYDHLIPHSKGGSDTDRNIQLLCEKCNREKSNKI